MAASLNYRSSNPIQMQSVAPKQSVASTKTSVFPGLNAPTQSIAPVTKKISITTIGGSSGGGSSSKTSVAPKTAAPIFPGLGAPTQSIAPVSAPAIDTSRFVPSGSGYLDTVAKQSVTATEAAKRSSVFYVPPVSSTISSLGGGGGLSPVSAPTPVVKSTIKYDEFWALPQSIAPVKDETQEDMQTINEVGKTFTPGAGYGFSMFGEEEGGVSKRATSVGKGATGAMAVDVDNTDLTRLAERADRMIGDMTVSGLTQIPMMSDSSVGNYALKIAEFNTRVAGNRGASALFGEDRTKVLADERQKLVSMVKINYPNVNTDILIANPSQQKSVVFKETTIPTTIKEISNILVEPKISGLRIEQPSKLDENIIKLQTQGQELAKIKNTLDTEKTDIENKKTYADTLEIDLNQKISVFTEQEKILEQDRMFLDAQKQMLDVTNPTQIGYYNKKVNEFNLRREALLKDYDILDKSQKNYLSFTDKLTKDISDFNMKGEGFTKKSDEYNAQISTIKSLATSRQEDFSKVAQKESEIFNKYFTSVAAVPKGTIKTIIGPGRVPTEISVKSVSGTTITGGPPEVSIKRKFSLLSPIEGLPIVGQYVGVNKELTDLNKTQKQFYEKWYPFDTSKMSFSDYKPVFIPQFPLERAKNILTQGINKENVDEALNIIDMGRVKIVREEGTTITPQKRAEDVVLTKLETQTDKYLTKEGIKTGVELAAITAITAGLGEAIPLIAKGTGVAAKIARVSMTKPVQRGMIGLYAGSEALRVPNIVSEFSEGRPTAAIGDIAGITARTGGFLTGIGVYKTTAGKPVEATIKNVKEMGMVTWGRAKHPIQTISRLLTPTEPIEYGPKWQPSLPTEPGFAQYTLGGKALSPAEYNKIVYGDIVAGPYKTPEGTFVSRIKGTTARMVGVGPKGKPEEIIGTVTESGIEFKKPYYQSTFAKDMYVVKNPKTGKIESISSDMIRTEPMMNRYGRVAVDAEGNPMYQTLVKYGPGRYDWTPIDADKYLVFGQYKTPSFTPKLIQPGARTWKTYIQTKTTPIETTTKVNWDKTFKELLSMDKRGQLMPGRPLRQVFKPLIEEHSGGSLVGERTGAISSPIPKTLVSEHPAFIERTYVSGLASAPAIEAPFQVTTPTTAYIPSIILPSSVVSGATTMPELLSTPTFKSVFDVKGITGVNTDILSMPEVISSAKTISGTSSITRTMPESRGISGIGNIPMEPIMIEREPIIQPEPILPIEKLPIEFGGLDFPFLFPDLGQGGGIKKPKRRLRQWMVVNPLRNLPARFFGTDIFAKQSQQNIQQYRQLSGGFKVPVKKKTNYDYANEASARMMGKTFGLNSQRVSKFLGKKMMRF